MCPCMTCCSGPASGGEEGVKPSSSMRALAPTGPGSPVPGHKSLRPRQQPCAYLEVPEGHIVGGQVGDEVVGCLYCRDEKLGEEGFPAPRHTGIKGHPTGRKGNPTGSKGHHTGSGCV